VILCKCFSTRLWFDTPHIFKQFSRIGTALSSALVNANITTFDQMLKMNAHELERILNKNAPFAELVLETIQKLPKLQIKFELINRSNMQISNDENLLLDIKCILNNYEELSKYENGGTLGYKSELIFIVGDEKNNLLCSQRLK
jgi:hypothetical protein